MKKDLLTLLSELSSNASEEDRERIRAEIQQLYRVSGSRLDSLVRSHRENLSQGLQSCSRIINTVSESKRRCQALKERISNCMEMLQFNRDNIRRMWLESLQHKYAHRILSEIEELRKIPRIVNEGLVSKKLEHATDVIVNSVKLLERTQCNADALKDLKLEVYNMQEKLYLMILEDLRQHVHLTDFLDRFSQCSGDVTYDDVFTNKIPKSDFYFKDVLGQVNFDRPYVQVLLKCVTTMGRLPETVNFLKDCCQEDLESLACQVSKFMQDIIQSSVDVSVLEMHQQRQRIFLIDLVESVFCVILKVAQQYKSLAEICASVDEPSLETGVGFHLADVYSKIQAAVEFFLSHYFDRHTSIVSRESLFFDSARNAADVSAYFNPQNITEDPSLNSFKFTNSFHSIASKKYFRGSRVLSGEFSDKTDEQAEEVILLCKPALENVTVVFKALKNFISEIEQVFDVEGIDSSPLYNFLCDSTNLFLDQVNSDVTKTLKSVSTNLESWITTPSGEHSAAREGSEKQSLVCSSLLDNILKELENLLTCLPDYSNHFLRLACFVLLDYKEMCSRVFKQMFAEEQNFLSISWAKDSDIRRFMKSFLNWRHLEDGDDQVCDVMIESPDEVRLRNQQESQLLIRNLRYEGGLSWLVIADMDKLASLALLQENLLWFSHRLQGFSKSFTKYEGVDIGSLKKLVKEFIDFADVCLLALHLEVRARCFHHLLPLSSSSAKIDFPHLLDSAIKGLTGDLLRIDEVLLPILSTKEFKYVFEGLGELVASLVIIIASGLTRLSDTVVLRLDRAVSTVQCCLSSVTASREVALERARSFIDLLKSTPEEVLDLVVEEGPVFDLRGYESVLRLLTSGEPEESHVGDYYLEKLRSIFGRLADGAKPGEGEGVSES